MQVNEQSNRASANPASVGLRYGRGEITVPIAPDWRPTIIRKPDMPVLENPRAAVAAALDASDLRARAIAAGSACIAICDTTRPVPNGLLLPPLLRTLLDAGLPPRAITLIVATGLHRPNEGDELRALIGDPWVRDTVQAVNHFARDDSAHTHVGTTSRGNDVRLDTRFVEADLRIVTGLVEPHFMAGWSGGRKVVAPGLAHADTIATFHSARYMEHANAENCVLDGNPLHGDQLEIIDMIGGAFAVNTVIDEQRRLSFVNCGEVVASHLEAVAAARRYSEIPVPRRFDTVVTGAAGDPLDATYYQTVKGMVGPLDILNPGGRLIIASACSEGFGSPEFADAQRRLIALGPQAFRASLLAKRRAAIDEWQSQKQLKPMQAGNVLLYTDGLSPSDRALTGVTMIDSVNDAIADSIARSGDPNVAFVPEGPYVVPFWRPQASAP